MKTATIVVMFLCYFSCGFLGAQDNEQQNLMEKYNIAIIEANIMKKDGINDSFMITKEYFNIRGYRTKIEIFAADGPKCYYDYIYAGDTLKTQRNTYCRGELVSVTRLFYNDDKLLTSCIDYDADGQEINTFEVREYDKNKRLKYLYLTLNGKRFMKQTINYSNSGNIKSMLYSFAKGRDKIIKYNKDGTLRISKNTKIVAVDDYKNTGFKMVRKTFINKEGKKIIAIGGPTSFKVGDEVMTEIYTDERGLVMQEIQEINNELVANKKYKYISR